MKQFFILIRTTIEDAFNNLSLLAAPLAPSLMLGVSVGVYMKSLYGSFLGILVGFAFGFGIEAAGYLSFKAYAKTKKLVMPISYILAGSTVTTVLEFGDWQRISIGLSGFAIVAIVYWSLTTIERAEVAEIARLEAEQKAAKELAAERQRLHEEKQQQDEIDRKLQIRRVRLALEEEERDAAHRRELEKENNQARLQRLAAKQATRDANGVANQVVKGLFGEVVNAVVNGTVDFEKLEVTPRQKEIVQLIKTTRPTTIKQLAEQLPISYEATRKQIGGLHQYLN